MKKTKGASFDPTFVIGLVIAMTCILGGLILEKGELRDVTQVTAALIVTAYRGGQNVYRYGVGVSQGAALELRFEGGRS